jgi:hypothetical protein
LLFTESVFRDTFRVAEKCNRLHESMQNKIKNIFKRRATQPLRDLSLTDDGHRKEEEKVNEKNTEL